MKYLNLCFCLLLLALPSFGQMNFRQVIYEKGEQVKDVLAFGDFDGDGRQDALRNSECVIDYFDGEFESKAWDSSYLLSNAFPADIDGDGDLDFLSAQAFSLLAFSNDGTGEFSISSVGTDTGYIVAVEDVNGDGSIDILQMASLTGYAPFQLLLYEFDEGTDEWSYSILLPEILAIDLPRSANYEDVDSDGDKDFTFATGYRLQRALCTGPGTFELQELATWEIGGFKAKLEPLKLNDDGIPDYVLGDELCNPSFAVSNTDGSYTFTDLDYDSACRLQFVHDANGDGMEDMLVRDADFKARWVYVDGNGGFEEDPDFWPISWTNYFVDFYALDYNGDDRDDIVSIDNNSDRILLHEASETGLESILLYKNDIVGADWYRDVDFDGDGLLDILVKSRRNSSIVLMRNTGDAEFELQILVENLLDPYYSDAIDFDNDGRMELIYAQQVGSQGPLASLYAVRFDEALEAQDTQLLLEGVENSSIFVEDMNSDGRHDIVVADHNVNVYETGSELGISLYDSLELYDTVLSQLVICDWNDDGFLDYLIASSTQDYYRIRLFPGDETGFVEGAEKLLYQIALPGTIFAYLSAGDWSNDGQVDLVFRAGTFGLLMSADEEGNIATSDTLNFVSSNNFNAINPVSVVDINHDGLPDIVSSDDAFLQTADGFQQEVYYTQEYTFEEVVTADFDGDGKLELVLLSTDDRLSHWEYGYEAPAITGLEDFMPVSILYPNPVSEILWVEGELNNGKIAVYNAAGQLIYEVDCQGLRQAIEVASWPDGLYSLVSSHRLGQSTARFVVMH